ncbi:MAG: hypothetical protein P0Y56_01735 [Candidatus Andeanibacterium colombiense]|uniref:Glycine zipper domain-containing protein n=1 Tax=Candidatus Andeanibacterium colombiense TaxID=3121345 RepID=A0AAJ6BNF3_9SPHN|nr:MAG: hypothetical protein P0Y56_01735 [Sphingomonadaceae bacterium]
MKHGLMTIALMGSALTLGACASNHAGEGALAGGALGAGVGLVTGGSVAEGAAIGAAAGAVGGALIKKDGKCYRRDRDGREHKVRCD